MPSQFPWAQNRQMKTGIILRWWLNAYMWCYENKRYKREKVRQFYVQFWEQLLLLPKRKGVPANE